ncbi:MAG: hypothetical protein GEV06_17700 [Luteitalea sp.]|nr:hypothetical protein [Luteitalea sp.]
MLRPTSKPPSWIANALLASSISLLLFFSSIKVDAEPFAADGLENMTAVYNLLKHSTFSTEPYYVYWLNPHHSEAAVRPNMYREPVPIAVAAVAAAVFGDEELSTLPLSRFNSKGSRFVRIVKIVNCLWLALSLVLVYYSLLFFTGNHYLSLAASLFPGVYVVSSGSMDESVNWFMSEVQGGALILASSLCLARAVQDQRKASFALAGLSLGLASLTKSILLFAYPLILLSLGGYAVAARLGRASIPGLAVFSAVFLAVVGPWMARNYAHFDRWAIASRGGVALYARSVVNDIANGKLHAALYWYSPDMLRPAVGKAAGISDDDFGINGRYEMINRDHRVGVDNEKIWDGDPSSTRSYFGDIFAEYRRRLLVVNQRGGEDDPVTVVDAQLYDRARNTILGDLVDHVKATPLFAYRGMWNDVLPPVMMLLVWILFGSYVCLAAAKRALTDLAFVIIPAAVYLMLSLTTLFIDRYSIILTWNAYAASVVMGYRLFESLLTARRESQPLADTG